MALARGQITIVSELDRLAGLRNLVVGGRRAISYTDYPTSPGWLHRKWQLSTLRPSSKREYCLGAWVEVTQGRPESISAILYDTASGSGRWTHNEIRASYDYTQGGRQWLTWSFPPYLSWPDGERLANQLLIYAGRAGHTQGIGITVSELCLLEGDVAPSSWIPAPEDVEADAMATARVQTITRHRDLVGIERDRLHEIYRKLRTDKRTPQDLGLRLEHLWISCNGAHAELDRACAAAIASPTDANNEAVNRLTGTYRAKVIDMQRGIQEAEEAIREAIFSEARGVSSARLDALALDPNKWYPITIELAATPSAARVERQFGLRLTRGLISTKGTPQEWWGHKDGYHFSLHWSVQPAGWGQRREDRRVYAYIRHFLREGTPVVSSPKQITEGSVEYVYVRGGSLYELSVVGLSGLSIQIHPEGYEWRTSPGDDTYLRRLPVLESIASIGEPRMELDILSDRLLAEIARERGELQRAIQAAQSSSSAALEARVQGVLAQVSQLEGLMRDGQAVLQRQIDRQVERWYGSEIAQSGVPPTSLWAASDNAKHEGDTYTCVAPRGITITPANAAQYPNVGRSWRWTNGGSGTAYGWELIADTDITQALALASRAQATADGKMTHYITPTPPVTYQQGDQWTLPAPWQGRKGGKAHTYPEGTILTATADSISGQHHPEHWVELVRYTDLSLEDIKLGGRNLYVGGSESPVLRPNNTGLGTTSTLNEGDLRYSRITPDASKAISVYSHIIPELVEEGVIYSMSVYIRHQHTTPVDVGLNTASGHTRTTIPPGKWVLWREEGVRPIPSGRISIKVYAPAGLAIDLRCLMVEKGNKSSDWTPAPEDVQAEIESKARELQAKLDEANRAITKAQGAADTAKRQADSAKSAAEANDGKIDEAEARGIAKTVSAYRQSLLTEWEALRSGYEALKTSEYLIDKQPLTTAYSTAKQRYDNLLDKITAILSNSKVSAQEYSQYTAAYAAYQPSAKTLADAIETAGKAIQAELLKRADDAAKGRVDSVKVGGRNYCRIADFPMVLHGGVARTRPFSEVLPAGEYMVSVKIRVLNDEVSHIAVLPTLDANHQGFEVQDTAVNGDGIYTIPVKPTKEWDRLYMYSNRRWQAVGTGGRVEISWVKVESGNRATDYTLAPEDVAEEAQRKADEAEARAKAEAERRAAEAEQRAKAEARRAAEEAERRAKEHADNQSRAEAEARAKLAQLLQTEHGRISALEYLKAVIAKGKQQAMKVKNGAVQIPLLLNNYIGILDLENKLRAYLSGDIASEVFLAAGLDDNGIPNLELTHLGGARFGQIYVRPDGLVEAKRSASARPYVRFGGEIEMLATLLGYTGQTITWPQSSASNCNRGYPDTVGSSTPGQLEYSRVDTLIAEMVITSGSDRDVSISGTMTLRALATMQQGTEGYAHASASGSIYLEDLGRGMRHQLYQSMAYMQTHNGQPVGSDYQQQAARTISLSKTIHSIPPGRYALRVAYALSINGYLNSYARGEVHGVSISAVPSRVFSETSFGTNGFSAMFGADKYLHVHSGEEAFVRSRGRWDVPGVLLSGRANLSGTLSNVYNPRPNTRPLSQRNEGGGEVTIRHNIGHTDYTVALTPVYAQGVERRPHMMMVVEQTATTIRVACWRQWGSSTNAQQCAFDFVFTGIN